MLIIYAFLMSWISLPDSVSEPEPSRKNTFTFQWGYNRSYYSKTNLHFSGPDYDFTVYDLKGHDRPSEFGWVYFNPGTITVPQYTYRLSYFITEGFAVSVGMDHMKYVVDQNQDTRISGVISPKASGKYAGSYLNQPIKLTQDLLVFEHTNGFNLLTIDFEYLIKLMPLRKIHADIQWNSGFGGVWVVAKTDVRVFGDGLDNDFHVAGYSTSIKSGPRVEFKKRFFLSAEVKGGYASLPSVLIKNSAPEVGDHNLYYMEYMIVAGYRFRASRKAKQ